jgi:hypothetical protein
MPALLVAACVGILLLTVSERMLKWIEAVLLHPPCYARPRVADLADRLSRAANSQAIAELTRRSIVQTVRPERASAIITTSRRSAYVDVDTRRRILTPESPLIESLARVRSAAVHVTDALLRSISASDASWLLKCEAELLVPLKCGDGHVAAVVALARKVNERPYNEEDVTFLAELSSLGAAALERRVAQPGCARSDTPAALSEQPALECSACGTVFPPSTAHGCIECGDTLELSQLPVMLAGKFKLRRRIGRGGMGIVYSAFDEGLRRWVAIKTLPYVSLAAEQRLRREAQIMARVSHPHIASIFGLEAWHDRPVLIVEYLTLATLADRLRRVQPPGIPEVIAWGLDLCQGLAYLHNQGLVHGDIKPSNIGFDAAGLPKLVDFGLADTFAQDPDTAGTAESSYPSGTRFGTPFYLCPDAVASELPSCPQFDLWSLALVLYEALAGDAVRNLATASGTPPLPLPDIRHFRHEVPDTVAGFFQRALHSRMELRPRSAMEFTLWLRHAGPVR